MAKSSSSIPGTKNWFQFFGLWVALPYMGGWLISSEILVPANFFAPFFSAPVKSAGNPEPFTLQSQQQRKAEEANSPILNRDRDHCWKVFLQHLDAEEAKAVDELLAASKAGKGISVAVHRNGQVTQCGTDMDILASLRKTLNSFQECPTAFHKYAMESLLSSTLHQAIATADCASEEPERTPEEGFLGFCDMGESKTPILPDHAKLVRVTVINPNTGQPQRYFPCHFHTREGLRVNSLKFLVSLLSDKLHNRPTGDARGRCQADTTNDSDTAGVCVAPPTDEGDDPVLQQQQANPPNEVHLYAVPAGRVFMFAPHHIGEIFDLPHITGADPTKPVYLKVMSLSPRVFDLFNFFTKEESAGLVTKAIAETSETHRIKRSSTGASGYTVNTRRTSESGFDTHGKTAVAVKKRCFDVLGFDEYIEGFGDGLQILRYNKTKAYTAHLDWIDDETKTQEHDFDSAGKGGNRFATILLYMSDQGEADGGETVFVDAKPLDEHTPDYNAALAQLRDSEHGALLKKGSWEESLVARCRSSLAVRPNSARAVLFYSQHPNGQPDENSLHGACPVLGDTPKWAANLWVWNTPRSGFPGAPFNQKVVEANRKKGNQPTPANEPEKKSVSFENTGNDPAFAKAELYYAPPGGDDQFWGKLGHGDPLLAVFAYEGQNWNIKVDGEIVKTYTVSKDKQQRYTL